MNLCEFFNQLDALPRTSRCGGVPIDQLVDLLRELELTREDIADHVNFGDTCYKRNLMRLGPPNPVPDDVELEDDCPPEAYAALIMCWRPGQRSPIHDHRGAACAVKVIEGECRETKYEPTNGALQPVKTSIYSEGHVCGSFDADKHELVNDQADRDLITLHIYTPPLTYVNIYDLETGDVGRCEDKEVARARAAALA